MTHKAAGLPLVERLDRDGLRSLASEWDDLLARSVTPNPYLSWAWVSAWADTIGHDADLQMFCARDCVGGTLIGVAPFVVTPRRRFGITYTALRLATAGHAGGSGLDALVDRDHRDAVARTMWAAVSRHRRWDAVELTGLSADGVLATSLLRRRSDGATSWPIPSLEIDLTHLPRHAPPSPDTDQHRLVTSIPDLDMTLDAIAAIPDGVPARGLATISHPSVAGFYRLATHRLLDSGRLRLWRRDRSGDLVGALLGVRFGDTVAVRHVVTRSAGSTQPDLTGLMVACAMSAADEGASRLVLPPRVASDPYPATRVHHLDARRSLAARARVVFIGDRVASAIRHLNPLSQDH